MTHELVLDKAFKKNLSNIDKEIILPSGIDNSSPDYPWQDKKSCKNQYSKNTQDHQNTEEDQGSQLRITQRIGEKSQQ